MLREAEEVCETEKESGDLKRMLEDYRTLLYHIGIVAIEGIEWFIGQGIRGVAETYKKPTPRG